MPRGGLGLLIVLGLLALTVAVYRDAGSFDLINFDDDIYVTANPRVLTGLSWKTSDGHSRRIMAATGTR